VRTALLASSALLAILVSGIPARAAEPPLCDYDIALIEQEGWSLDVTIACRRLVEGFAFADDFPSDWLTDFTDDRRRPLLQDGPAVWGGSDGPVRGARYWIDLDGMAESIDDFNSAKNSGRSVLVALSGIMPIPILAEPPDDTTLTLHFQAPYGGDIATSLPRVGDAYEIRADEVDSASPVVFGTFERRTIAVPLPMSLAPGDAAADAKDLKGEIELVILDGALTATTDELANWVHATALANAELWRGFPVARSTVVAIPVPGRASVPFGRVTSTGGIVVRLMVGAEIEPRALYDEWVLVHEFIHLGTPYIRDTGAWLNEGLATYLEPIVRYRAGWRSERSVWDEWTSFMGRGLEPMRKGLGKGNPYWGGALYWLMADVELRRLTEGQRGIEDCLRTILAHSGDVSVQARTMATLSLCERDMPAPVLTELAQKHSAGAPTDLFALFDALGVKRSRTAILFDDAAPLAKVRQWLLSGGPQAEPRPIPIPADL
jgi:hypothetical protein